MTALPPSEAGASHETSAVPLAAVAAAPVGAPGAVNGKPIVNGESEVVVPHTTWATVSTDVVTSVQTPAL